MYVWNKVCDWIELSFNPRICQRGLSFCSLLQLPWCQLAQWLFSWIVKKTEKWLYPHAAVPALHLIMASWLHFHACQCDTAKAFLKFLPKYSPQPSLVCCKKGRNIAWKVLICSNLHLDFHFLGLAGKNRLKLGCHFCPFFWVVEWLMWKTCLKRQQRGVYAESSQVQIASKSPCQVIFASIRIMSESSRFFKLLM